MLSVEIEKFMDNEVRVKIIFDSQSYISGVVYIDDGELYINYFHVNPINRGKGIGSKLLVKVIEESKERFNINKVLLDDESQNYRKPRNIYIKHGFGYLNNNDKAMSLKI